MKFDTYEGMIDTFLKEDSTEVFGNFSLEYARSIHSKFIDSAYQEIVILFHSLNNDFYNRLDFINAAKRIYKEDCIKIISIDNDDERILKLEKEINEECGKRVLRYIPAKYKGENCLKHFLVCDSKRYRLEGSHNPFKDGKQPKTTKAEVCCNTHEAIH